ncbi:MAG: hypothetical protein LBR88_08705 [Zoogloeaceae bacterium]|jgi:hypothetical protein|nr:hypothetical protein [Zoogloeaceae bacterium]
MTKQKNPLLAAAMLPSTQPEPEHPKAELDKNVGPWRTKLLDLIRSRLSYDSLVRLAELEMTQKEDAAKLAITAATAELKVAIVNTATARLSPLLEAMKRAIDASNHVLGQSTGSSVRFFLQQKNSNIADLEVDYHAGRLTKDDLSLLTEQEEAIARLNTDASVSGFVACRDTLGSFQRQALEFYESIGFSFINRTTKKGGN